MTKTLTYAAIMKMRRSERADLVGDYVNEVEKVLTKYRFNSRMSHRASMHAENLFREGVYNRMTPRIKPSLYRETLPWGRERFYSNKRHVRGCKLMSWTGTTLGGKIQRGFTRTFEHSELEAYETEGRKSCPIEAVWLPSVRPGYPGVPAYPFVLAHDRFHPEHGRGLAAVLDLIDADLVSEDSAEQMNWLKPYAYES